MRVPGLAIVGRRGLRDPTEEGTKFVPWRGGVENDARGFSIKAEGKSLCNVPRVSLPTWQEALSELAAAAKAAGAAPGAAPAAAEPAD